MKAIIIAAGLGSRLEHHTADKPKCMVEVDGRSIIDYQLDSLAQNDIDDIHIVRGYLADKLVVDGATYHENDAFRANNVLASLFYAKEAMDGPFVSSYSDIVYTPAVVRRAVDSPHDIALVVDRQWRRAYEGRQDHPPAQAELAEVDAGHSDAGHSDAGHSEQVGQIKRVGKQVGPEAAAGEFIGLAKYSAAGARQMRRVYEQICGTVGPDQPFHNADRRRQAYLTDLFMELIDRGVDIGWAPIDGGWREVDTVEDLRRVRRQWSG